MSKTVGCLLAVVAVLVVLGFVGVGQYNGLVAAEQGVEEASTSDAPTWCPTWSRRSRARRRSSRRR
jgi:hypothetical protein